MDDSGSECVKYLCLDDQVMALLITGVSGMDRRSESIARGLHGTASIRLATFPAMAAATIA